MELLWFMLGTLAVAAAVAGALCLLGTPSASASASASATASVRTGAGGGKPGNGRSYPRARAATVPVRCDPGGRLAVLLVRSRNHPESFVFPGGGIEPGESEQEAARRETEEEAGVVGRIGRRLGSHSDERRNTTALFVLHVHDTLDEWAEAGERGNRQWHSLGVVGTRASEAALARLGAALHVKPVHQETLRLLRDQLAAVASEAEREELATRAGRAEIADAPAPARRR